MTDRGGSGLRNKGLLAALALAALALGAGSAAAAPCEELKGQKFGDAEVLTAETVTSGVFIEPASSPRAGRKFADLPSFCRVTGVTRPTAKSKIGFEMWLPTEKWTTRLHMIGNGGFDSYIAYPRLSDRIRAGDVVVGTDTGHSGDDLSFGYDNPDAIVDWGHRSVHETVVAAKAITKAFYAKPPAFSYFSGCSTGGHQALQSIQRYPDDFDGVIAGAPGNNRTNLSLSFLWQWQHNHVRGDNENQIIPNSKLRMVNRAIVAICDPIDGLKDGIINDPRACRFDLTSLQCKDGDKPDCLTPPQISAMRAIYQGPRDARTGKQIYPGYQYSQEGSQEEPTSKAGWSGYWANPRKPNEPQRLDLIRRWVFNDPAWDWWTFDWGKDVDTVTKVMGPILNATNPDLDRFRAKGGKLIMFMGWEDPVGAPMEAINYYESVRARGKGSSPAQKLADTQSFARLYMVPGMPHCAGGDGATNFSSATRDSNPPANDETHDMAVALEAWVEKGRAPEAIIATRYKDEDAATGEIEFQRPICVYPKMPRYKGGDPNSASSFECRVPKTAGAAKKS